MNPNTQTKYVFLSDAIDEFVSSDNVSHLVPSSNLQDSNMTETRYWQPCNN